MILPIITGKANLTLRTGSKPVKKIDSAIKKLIQDMLDTLVDAQGLGIAAPQIGVNKQVVIVRMNHNTPHEMYMPMINPHIIREGLSREEKEEGCLSIKGLYGKTMRLITVTVKFIDKKGQEQILNLEGLNAHIMQHEIDHLSGILFVDRLIKESTTKPVTKGLQQRVRKKKDQ